MSVTIVNESSSSVDPFAAGTTAPRSGTVTSARMILPDPSSSLAAYVIQTTIDGAPTAIVVSGSPLNGGTLGIPSSSSTSNKSFKLPLIITLATTAGALLLIGLCLFLRRHRRKLSTSSIVPFQSESRLSPSTHMEVVTQEHTPETSPSQLKASIFPAEKMPADRPETQPRALERNIPINTAPSFTPPTVLTQRPGAGGTNALWEDAQVLVLLDVPPSYESVQPRSYIQS
ncbi:hypothetical protein BJ165DRAFT_1525652 [Panaeolus papilionaceus]|nr:hypothetical protein BJ165DRAFT_1525652 [Panaeolus papilionaceus]